MEKLLIPLIIVMAIAFLFTIFGALTFILISKRKNGSIMRKDLIEVLKLVSIAIGIEIIVTLTCLMIINFG